MSVTAEQARRLSQAAGVDVIAALSALERQDGDALEAMLELERQGLASPPPGGGFYSTRRAGSGQTPPGAPEERADEGRRRGGVLVLTGSDLGRALGGFFRRLLSFRMEVRRDGHMVTSVPLPVLAVLLLFFFWRMALVLGVGLLLGFRYRLSGAPPEEGGGLLAALKEAVDRQLERMRR